MSSIEINTAEKVQEASEQASFRTRQDYKAMKKKDLIDEIFRVHEVVFKAFKGLRNDLQLLEQANKERQILWDEIIAIEYVIQKLKEGQQLSAKVTVEEIEKIIAAGFTNCKVYGKW